MRRLLHLIWVAALAAVVGCAPRALIRAHPIQIEPPPGAVLGATPNRAEIAFTAPVLGDRSSLVVVAADGSVVSEPSRVEAADPRRLVAPLRDLPGGAYELIWRSVEASTRAELDGQEHFWIEPNAPSRPSIELSSAELDANQPLSIVGTGFSPSTRVVVTIGDDGQDLAVTSSRDDGGFVVASVPVPPDLPLGQQLVLARDNNGAAASALLRVHWGGWPPLRLSLVSRAGPRPGLVTVAIGGRNRSDYVLRDVRIILPLPAGSSLVSATSGGREDNGAVVWDTVSSLERGPLEPRSATLRIDAATPPRLRAWAQYGHLPSSSPLWGNLPGFFSNAVSSEG